MSEQATSEQRRIWASFTRAVGAEPQEVRNVRGVSGLDHPVEAVAVDEVGRRVVVVSAEASPRVAALMQVDVQAAMPDMRVLVARPVIIDIGVLARRMLAPLSATTVNIADMTSRMNQLNAMSEEDRSEVYKKYFGGVLSPVAKAWSKVQLPTFNQIVDVVNQAAMIDWKAIGDQIGETAADSTIDITSLYKIDNTELDRRHGICPIPLYEFADKEWGLLLDGGDLDELRGRLKDFDIYQYFYPSPDQLALGFVDRGLRREDDVVRAVESAPSLGHGLSDAEILGTLGRISEVVDGLKETGHVVDGEFGLELSSPGASIRGSIKFRPREGIISKVLNRISVNLSASPKDFL